MRACVCFFRVRASFRSWCHCRPLDPAPQISSPCLLPIRASQTGEPGACGSALFLYPLHFSDEKAPAGPHQPHICPEFRIVPLSVPQSACPCSLVPPPPLVALGLPAADYGVTLRWHNIRPGLPCPARVTPGDALVDPPGGPRCKGTCSGRARLPSAAGRGRCSGALLLPPCPFPTLSPHPPSLTKTENKALLPHCPSPSRMLLLR